MTGAPLALAGPFPLSSVTVFGRDLEPFGVLTALAIILGVGIGIRRARMLGLSEAVLFQVSIFAVFSGFVGSHLVYTLGYAPEKLAEDPLYILKIWTGMSNVGGWIGGYVGVWLYFAVGRRELPFLPYADACAYGIAFAWIFGRLACTVSFDHPGSLTNSFLGMDFPGTRELEAGVRHNVGFYELLVSLTIFLIFHSQRHRPKFRGWYAVMLVLAYAPLRFPLDFLRVVDARYAGLSPAQWLSLGLLPVFGALAFWASRHGDPLVPDGIPKAEFYPGGRVPGGAEGE